MFCDGVLGGWNNGELRFVWRGSTDCERHHLIIVIRALIVIMDVETKCILNLVTTEPYVNSLRYDIIPFWQDIDRVLALRLAQ